MRRRKDYPDAILLGMKTPAQLRGDAIRRAREAKGWSQDRLGQAVNISQPAIKKIEDGVTERSKFLPDIEAILGLTRGSQSLNTSAPSPSGSALLIYGTAEGGNGSLMYSNDVIDTIPMPERLAQVPDAYGLYVAGESMVPKYRPGDLLLIHPYLPPRAEDGVVIYSLDKSLVQVKEFVRATATEWVLRRYKPIEEEFSILKADWPKCHVVYGSYSRR